MSKIFPLFIVLMLSGCQSGPYPESSSYFRIPTGSQLIVKQALTIRANTASVYLQDGKAVTHSQIDQYNAHCWFLSWKVVEQNQVIKPGQFIVTGVRELEEFVYRQGEIYLAGNSRSGLRGMTNGATAIEYKTELTIHSDEQPDIRKLICNHWEDPADARHLTLAEIRTTLGALVDIKLKK